MRASPLRFIEYSARRIRRISFPGSKASATACSGNASWLAPNHYVPEMDRLIVTIQIWVLKVGGNVIVIDTGVGNRKPRPAERMDRLNTLVMPWLEAAGAGPSQVTHVVMTHLHTDHVGWNTEQKNGEWVPTFPKARYLIPQTEFGYWKALYDQGDAGVNGGSFADSVLPILDAGLGDFMDGTKEVAGCLTPEPSPVTRPACYRSACAPAAKRASSAPT